MVADALAPEHARLLETALEWLLTYTLHSTLLLGGIWLVTRWDRVSDALRDTLWKVALVGGLVTATVQAATGWQPATALRLEDAALRASAPWSAAAAEPATPRPADAAAPSTPESASPAAAPGAGFAAGAPARGTASERSFPWSVALFGAWAAVGLLLLLRHAVARVRLSRMLEDRREVVEEQVVGQLAGLCVSAGVRRGVRLTCSGRIGTPIALGREEICLPPRALTELDPAQQQSVLAHELAHLVRGDTAWLALAAVVESLFFFQPLNRVARRRMQEVSEYLCDEWAVRHTGRGIVLARSLAEVAGWSARTTRPLPLAGMAESGSPLSRRVQRLLTGSWPASVWVRRPLRVLLALGVVAGVGALAPGVSVGADAEPAPPAAPALVVPAAAHQGTPADTGRSGLRMQGSNRRSWNRGGGRSLVVETRGDVQLSGGRVVRIAEGGHLRVRDRTARPARQVEARPENGAIRYRYEVNGRVRPLDDEGRRWLAGVLRDLEGEEKEMEVQRERLAREEERLRGEARRIRTEGARPRAAVPGLDLLEEAERVESDGDRARLLEGAAPRLSGSSEARLRYLRAARGIESDGDRRRALQALMAAEPGMAAEEWSELLRAARGMGSDGDKEIFLGRAAGRMPRSDAVHVAYLETARSIGSDGDRRRALYALCARQELSTATRARLLHAAGEIGSDGEKSTLLVQLAPKVGRDPTLLDAYRRAARSIDSEADRTRALAAVERPRASGYATTRTGEPSTVLVSTDSHDGSATHYRLEARGVVLEADRARVKEILPGGFLYLEEKRGSTTRSARMEPGPDGKLRYTALSGGMSSEELGAWQERVVARFGRNAGKSRRW